MGKGGDLNLVQIIVLIGGFIALLYSFYYMQQLSYSIGIYSGISKTITAYNITNSTASEALLGSISQSATLQLALHLAYTLLPFVIIIFAIGILWFFSKSYSRLTASILIISATIYIILIAILELDFGFNGALSTFPVAYIGGALALAGGAYPLLNAYYRPSQQKRARPVQIYSDTPYSNMRLLSRRIMGKLKGEVMILDMHFDVNSLDNLMQLVDKHTQQYSKISVITSSMRLGSGFDKSYSDFKKEMANRNVEFELRVLSQDTASKQHERILMDGSIAYKIPPINIINKKNEHIVGINQRQAQALFNNLWSKATKYENMK